MWKQKMGLQFVLMSHKSIHGRGKLSLQYSYNINCISELILISWNFMRLCYLWADAATAPNWLNSSSCGLQRPNPKRRWSGSHGRLASYAGDSDPTHLLTSVTKNPAQFCQWTHDYVSSCLQVFGGRSSVFFASERCDVCVGLDLVLRRKCGSIIRQYEICGCQLVCAQQDPGVHVQHHK